MMSTAYNTRSLRMHRRYGRCTYRWALVPVVLGVWALTYGLPCAGKGDLPEAGKNTLVIAIASPVQTGDPTNYRDRTTQMVLKNVFDALVTRDAHMDLAAQLAESWKPLDPVTWEFRLRRNVRFHNGDPFTALDVRFTLERVVSEGGVDGKTSCRQELLSGVESVEVVDRYTVHIRTRTPWALLPLMLTLQEIVPEDYLKAAGTEGFAREPVGTGPFRWVEARASESVVLERFEKYYGGSPNNPPVQKPPIRRLVFRTVPLMAEQIAMLKSGRCDIVCNLPPAAIPIVQMHPDLCVLHRPPTRSFFAEINCRKSPFDDPQLRRALNHAVDTEAVVRHLLRGYGQVLPTALLPNAFAYNGALKPYVHDPLLAGTMLAASGFPKGRTVSIQCGKDNADYAGLIAAFLTKVGLPCSIDLVPGNAPHTRGRDAAWDLFVSSWGNTTLDPIDILLPKFMTNGSANFSGYTNAEVDTLLQEGGRTLDPLLREEAYKRVQEIVYRQAPMIFGYAAREFLGVRKRVKNYVPSPTGWMNMHDVYLDDRS